MGFLWFVVFFILNLVNSYVIIGSTYDAGSWQYWLGVLCTCGSYFAGAMRYRNKN